MMKKEPNVSNPASNEFNELMLKLEEKYKLLKNTLTFKGHTTYRETMSDESIKTFISLYYDMNSLYNLIEKNIPTVSDELDLSLTRTKDNLKENKLIIYKCLNDNNMKNIVGRWLSENTCLNPVIISELLLYVDSIRNMKRPIDLYRYANIPTMYYTSSSSKTSVVYNGNFSNFCKKRIIPSFIRKQNEPNNIYGAIYQKAKVIYDAELNRNSENHVDEKEINKLASFYTLRMFLDSLFELCHNIK